MLLMVSLLGAFSSSMFFGMWLALELNLIAFVAWCFSSNNKPAGVKYFFAQTFLSSLMLFFFCFFCITESYFATMAMYLALWSKTGMPPWYYWFLNACVMASYDCLFIMSTVQKIIPIMLLAIYGTFSWIFFNFVLMVLLAGILNQMMVKKILVYSSIFHILWFYVSFQSQSFLALFLFAYTLSMWWVCKVFDSLPAAELIDDFLFSTLTSKKIILIFLVVMNLAGVPPFFSFSAKMAVALEMVQLASVDQMTIVIYLTVWTFFLVYAYIRLFTVMLTQKKILPLNTISTSSPLDTYSWALLILSMLFLSI